MDTNQRRQKLKGCGDIYSFHFSQASAIMALPTYPSIHHQTPQTTTTIIAHPPHRSPPSSSIPHRTSISTGMLSLQRILIVRKDLAAQIKDRQGAGNTSRCTSRDDREVPAHDHCDEPESTGDLEIVDCVCCACGSGVVAELVVACGEEGEEEAEGRDFVSERKDRSHVVRR